MEVTLLGIVFLQPTTNEFEDVSIIALQPSRESYFEFPFLTIIDERPVQYANAPSPIEVTLLPTVTEVSPVH